MGFVGMVKLWPMGFVGMWCRPPIRMWSRLACFVSMWSYHNYVVFMNTDSYHTI